MQVTCRLLNQESFTVAAEPSTTVGELKKKIEELKGDEFKSDTLKLIHSGKIWDNNEATLETENYKESGFVVVMARKPSVKPAEIPKAQTEPKTQSQPASQPAQAPQQPAAPIAQNPAQQPPAAGLPQNIGFGISPDKYNEMVDAIVQMGYPKSEVESALRASYFNPERAVEYLISGLPPVSAGVPPAVLSGNPAGAAQRPVQGQPQGQPAAEAGADPLAFFRDSPQFQQMRQMIQQDPQLLRNFMNDIGQANPQLMQTIRDHEEDFLAMLNAEGGAEGEEDLPEGLEGLQAALGGLAGAGGGAPPPGVHYVNVTPDENQAIERLKAMGFPEQLVIEAFFACDKNEEMAANFLLANLDDLDQSGRGQ